MEDIDRNPKRDFFEPFYGWNPAKIAQLVATLNYAKGMNAYGQDFMVPRAFLKPWGSTVVMSWGVFFLLGMRQYLPPKEKS
jgi:hypothetical protein